MGQIWDINIEAIKKYKPSLSWVLSYTEPDNIEVVQKMEKPSIRVVNEDKKITLHSVYNPEKEAALWANSIEKKPNAQYLIFGFGLGYHIRELKKQIRNLPENNDSFIIVIEPSYDIFYKALEVIDLTDIIQDNKILILTCPDESLIVRNLKEAMNVAVYTGGSVVWGNLNPYTILFCDIYIQLGKQMDNFHKEAIVSRNTTMTYSHTWQENLLKNLQHVLTSYPVNVFEDKFKDVPAIIVSAGPSLNRNIQLLKEVGDKAVIISTDTALKALFKNGIVPHLVISIDGSEKNYEKYSEINYDNIPLVFTPKVNYRIINKHKGKKVLFSCGDIYTEFLLNKFDIQVYSLLSGGSVANNALHFATLIGANPVTFIGQDLAYTNNKSHADGTMYDGKNEIKRDGNDKNSGDMYVKDIFGGEVLTDRSFYIFLKWFEEFIKNDNSERKYIDSTEGGAFIEGTEVLPLKESIDRYMTSDYNISDRINELFSSEKPINDYFNIDEIIGYLKKQKNTFYELSKKCKGTSELCNDLKTEYDKAQPNEAKVSANLKKLDKLDKYIKRKSEEMSMLQHILEPVFYKVYSSENTKARQNKEETQREKDIFIIDSSKMFYSGIREAIEFTMPLLDDCILDLENII